ncbi:MAG: hypothetical protein NC248_09320 [Bacteroides sp.]|nr:hypothetical protein [Bacteroides sp.]MCM1389847.1 hypothetical protein [Bacteroides sp.]
METVQPNFDLKDFNKLSDNVYLLKSPDLDITTKIYKYTDLRALFAISDGKFRISKRNSYSDYWELGEDDLRNPEHLHSVGLPYTQHDAEQLHRQLEYRKKTSHLLTSCFTLESDELYSMWKCFAPSDTGIRITTTIGDFIDSIDISGYTTFIGKMCYQKYDVGVSNPLFLFTKKEFYSTEKEIRFYFVPNDRSISQETHVMLKINPVVMVSEILLSPFIKESKMKGWMLKSLKSEFSLLSDKFNHSSIRISNIP